MIELEEFRAKARDWLAANASHYRDVDPADLVAGRAFRRDLWDAGLLGITLDAAYGGQNLTPAHQNAFTEEAARYALPPMGEAVTTGICAPTLLDFGSEQQKKRHVGRMIRGDEVWTQLLSEPGAGSDLAGLQTRAVRDGDEYVINGQKVWTSRAVDSDFALCIVRTDPDLPKHQGLSMLIVDLKAPGVTIRPLRQMTGDAHFNEVFLDDVRVAADQLVGRENDGWRALTAMLTHERLALGAGTGAGGSGQGWTSPASARFIDLARRNGSNENPVVRQELVRLYIAERVLAFVGQKMRDEIAAGIPVGSKGSVAKLATALISKQSAGVGMAIVGPASQAWDEGEAGAWRGGTHASGGTAAAGAGAGGTGTGTAGGAGEFARAMCFSPMTAIAGGTSEIQRNTIGERVLGLPKEPQVDREIPFRDILQNPLRSGASAT
jgi:alkylation response protein AidB-like acyl-CoA dehydrogenase